MNQNSVFEEKLEELMTLIFEYQPSTAVFLGKSGYDNKVANGTKEKYEEFIKTYLEQVESIKNIPASGLLEKNKETQEIIIRSSEIFQFLHEAFPLWRKDPYGIEDIQNVIFLTLQRQGPSLKGVKVIIEQLKQLPKFLNEFHTRITEEKIPKLWKSIAYRRIETTPQFFDYLNMIFTEEGIGQEKKQELTEVIEKAKIAIDNHQKWIQERQTDEDEYAWALGEDNFAKYIELRKLPWNTESILKKGYELLESLTEKSRNLAKKINPNKTYDEVLDEILLYHPPTFEMVLEHASSEVRRAKEFLKKKKLLTMPEKEKLRVIETPSYLAPLIPFAMCVPAPYYLPEEPGYYSMTRPQTQEGLKQHCYYSISNAMVHEAYPGHHIDGVCSNMVSSAYNMIAYFISSLGVETIEGWAHYCEEMMLEEGFHEDKDKVELIILLDQIWRAVRIIVDVELHSKKRTYEKAVDMLMTHARMEKAEAIAEVSRYTMAPTYQLSYLMGKLLIQDLKKKQEEKLGGKFSLQEFHDTIIYSGDLPYYLLKELFEKEKN